MDDEEQAARIRERGCGRIATCRDRDQESAHDATSNDVAAELWASTVVAQNCHPIVTGRNHAGGVSVRNRRK